MNSKFFNLKVLAVVALPMLVAVFANAEAQVVPVSANATRGHVVSAAITVVNTNGESLTSNDGGKHWQVAKQATSAATINTTVGPNPTSGMTTINYQLPQSGEVLLTMFDGRGVEVTRQAEGMQQAGANATTVDATQLPNGVYYYRLTVDGVTMSGGRMMVAH